MKISPLPLLLIAVALPASLLATPEIDRKIEAAAKASYNYRMVLEDHVQAKANEGIVTLTGTVQDKDDKELAADTVQNLPGVTGINNDIVVKAMLPEHSDEWIALKVRSRLLVKGSVSAVSTTVTVENGVVTLGGTADSAAQKELTAVYAREIDWVKSVTNNIAVKASASSSTLGETIDDASITSQVKYALLRHQGTNTLKTRISAHDGVIAISGEAGSDAEKALVTKLAQDVRGVKSVSNAMTVKS